jgi:hypothetical protein
MTDKFRVRVDAERTSAEFKLARKLVRSKAKQGLKEAGQRSLLPPVKRAAPAVVSPYLTTKATARSGYVTTLGPKMKDRIAGLLNFGGLVSTKIVPKKKEALHIRGTNVVVASVGNGQRARGRKYKGEHFIEHGVTAGYPDFERRVTSTVMSAFGELAS